jgi:hypothetical protein
MSRWPITGPSGYWLLASSPASRVKQQYTHSITNTQTHSTTNTHKMTIHTWQIQLTKTHIRKTTPGKKVLYIVSNIFAHTYCTHAFTLELHFSPLYYPYIPFPLRAAFTPSLHCTSLHYTFRWFSLHLTSLHFRWFSHHLTSLHFFFISPH